MKTKSRVIVMALALVAALFFTALPAMAKDYLYVPVSNNLHIVDCDTDQIVKTIKYNDYILNSTYSPDGSRYYLNAQDKIHVIDTDKNELIDTIPFSTALNKVVLQGMSVSLDGSKLYLTGNITKKKRNIPKLNVVPPQFMVFDLKTKKLIKSYPITMGMTAIVPIYDDPDSVFLFGLDLFKLNIRTGKKTKIMGFLNPMKGQEPMNALINWQNTSPKDHGIFTVPVYTPTAMKYMFVDKNTGKVSLLDTKDMWFAYSSALSPDKKYLYAVMDELIKVDAKTGKTLKAVPVEEGTCYAVTITSDGKKVYAGPGGNDLSVYNAADLKLLGVIPLAADGDAIHRITK